MPKPTARPTVAEELRRTVRERGPSVSAVAKAAAIAQPVLYRVVTGARGGWSRTGVNRPA